MEKVFIIGRDGFPLGVRYTEVVIRIRKYIDKKLILQMINGRFVLLSDIKKR